MSWLHNWNGLTLWTPGWDVAFILAVGAVLAVLRLLRPSGPPHVGDQEHPVGSQPKCPACQHWRAR
jgi:hypothetical protein